MPSRKMLPEIRRGERALNPIREMSRLQRRIDHMFDEFFSEPGYFQLFQPYQELFPEEEQFGFIPPVDVNETESQYLVSFDLPGIKKEEVKIELHDNQLTVSGERKKEHEEEAHGKVSRERYYGAFSRSFTLPSDVKPEQVEARYENGVLQIAIPKTEAKAGKQIEIKEGKLTLPKKEMKKEKAA